MLPLIALIDSMTIVDSVLLYALPPIGCTLLAYAVFNLVADLRRKELKKVAERLKDNGSMREYASEEAAKESIMRRMHQAQSPFGVFISGLAFVPRLQQWLDQANIQWPATTVIINLIGLGSVGYISCYFLQTAQWVMLSVAAGLVLLPLLVILTLRKLRLNRFMHQLPDVFELMSQALRAGHSLANSILVVSQQLPDPVGTEFARVFHEQNLGIKIEDALKDMARRVGMMDVRFFVTAVLIQRQTGGDLAEVLDNISSVIRDRIKLFGSVKALTAEGRLSGYVLLALPIFVFVLELVINPSYAQIMLDDEVGQYMLIGAGVSQVLGLALIQKIVNIKV